MHRTEPFGDFSTIAGGPVLTKNHPSNANITLEARVSGRKSNEGLTLIGASSALSPKPTNYEDIPRKAQGLSSDKISLDVDVPVAQIIIPTATNRKALEEVKPVGQNQEVNVRQSYGLLTRAQRSATKMAQSLVTSALSDYAKQRQCTETNNETSRPSGGAAQQAVSSFSLKRTLENSKQPMFRTKRRSEMRTCTGGHQMGVGASRFGPSHYDRTSGALGNGQRSAGKFSTSGQQ